MDCDLRLLLALPAGTEYGEKRDGEHQVRCQGSAQGGRDEPLQDDSQHLVAERMHQHTSLFRDQGR